MEEIPVATGRARKCPHAEKDRPWGATLHKAVIEEGHLSAGIVPAHQEAPWAERTAEGQRRSKRPRMGD